MSFVRSRTVRPRRTAAVPGILVESLEQRALLAAAPVPNVLATIGDAGSSADTTAFHQALAADKEGNTYVAGLFNGTIDLDGAPDRQFTLTSTLADPYLVLFFAKYDPQGRPLWAHQFQGGSPAVTVGPSGDVYLAFGFGGSLDADPGPGTSLLVVDSGMAVIRFDSDGTFVTAAKFRTRKQSMMATGIGTDAKGHVYVLAQSFIIPTPQKPLDYDTVLYGLSDDLQYRYAYRWGAKHHQTEPRDLAVNPDGSVYVAGKTWTGVDFHPARRKVRKVPDGFDNRNVFLLRINPKGQFDWVMGLRSPMHTSPDLEALAPDGQGGVWVTGDYSTGVDFDPAKRKVFAPKAYEDRFRDSFIARYTAKGALAKFWSLGEAGDMYEPSSLAVDPATGNLAVSGGLQTQSWETDPTGGQRLTGSDAAFFATYTPAGELLGSRAVKFAWASSAPGGRLVSAFGGGGTLFLLGQSGQPALRTYAPGEDEDSIDIGGADVFVLKVL
jgi:DNA-binding beta-propeller fold protein YncE